jgi:G:T-mismatch repair DNA endonuclease (very short patch repair protein)
MTDVFSREQRSKPMKAIRSKGNYIGDIVGKELWKKEKDLGRTFEN